MDTHTTSTSGTALRALIGVTVVGAVGCLLMALAHAGVEVPVLRALGPGGDTVVPQAAAGFAVGAVLYTITAVGLVRRRPWSWALGVAVSALVVLAAAVPFRGPGSVAGIVLGAVGAGLLLSRPVRTGLLPR